LLTLHSAKGLEFPHVYLVGMEEGLLPHHRSLGDASHVEEERRLCYVGVTRAQERLTLSLSLTRMKWGKPRDTIPSRFLFEITGQADQAPPSRGSAATRRGARKPSPSAPG
jgi:DNA helicase-2/ATP-dependent DNA helicase PcrA